jgi:hypothetical protein
METSHNVSVEGARVVIPGVDKYRVPEPLFECVRVVLSHRGETYSTDYIQGISGAAFRIAGICPCAPTCSFAMETPALAALFGYEVKVERCEGGGWERGETNVAGQLAKMAEEGVLPDAQDISQPDLKALRQRLQTLIDRTKAEVRAGRPVIFWHGFTTAEFDVVCGYDGEKKLLLGRGSYAGDSDEYAEAPETRAIGTALVGGSPTTVLIGHKVRDFEVRTAEVAALCEAVKHGRSRKGIDVKDAAQWQMLDGIACYERWARDFEAPDRKRGMGDAYCYGIVRRTHRSAAGFLREIAPRYPEAETHLNVAATEFKKEAETLDTAEDLLGWNSSAEPDAERNRKTAAVLDEATAAYTAGIAAIERAVESIGGVDAGSVNGTR